MTVQQREWISFTQASPFWNFSTWLANFPTKNVHSEKIRLKKKRTSYTLQWKWLKTLQYNIFWVQIKQRPVWHCCRVFLPNKSTLWSMVYIITKNFIWLKFPEGCVLNFVLRQTCQRLLISGDGELSTNIAVILISRHPPVTDKNQLLACMNILHTNLMREN